MHSSILRVLALYLVVVTVTIEAKGEFQVPSRLTTPPSQEVFTSERLTSFRGGFDRGTAFPDRARRPQPDYDNTEYAGANFFEHELIYLEGDKILDWKPRTGEYRVFELVRHPENLCPVIPERPVTSGVWPNRKFHKLMYIGCSGAPPGGKIFDYNPSEGTYEVFRFNHKAGPGEDPILESLSKGFRLEVMNFQPLYLNEDEVLFYERKTGKYSIYYLNNQLPSNIDPIQPPEPIVYGKLQGLHEQLIYLGKNTIMDYDPLFGRYWLYLYDRTSINMTNPFIGPLASGTIERGMVPTYIAEDEMVILDPQTGMFTVFEINRPRKYDHYHEESRPFEEREAERVAILQLSGPKFELKKETGNFGYGTLIKPNACAEENSCRSCLKRPGCGWCATSGACYRGSTVQPCATNCTTWQPVFCEAEPCSSHKGCSNCVSDPFCGWCSDSASCTEGTSSGPLFGTCEGWNKVFCPSYSESESITPSTPCVEDGLISL